MSVERGVHPDQCELLPNESIYVRKPDWKNPRDISIAAVLDLQSLDALHPFDASHKPMTLPELVRWVKGDRNNTIYFPTGSMSDAPAGFIYFYRDNDVKIRSEVLRTSSGNWYTGCDIWEINWNLDRASVNQQKLALRQAINDFTANRTNVNRPLMVALFSEPGDELDVEIAKELGFLTMSKEFNYERPGTVGNNVALCLFLEAGDSVGVS